jgi:D-alanyl-D-alanine dipeptidase
MAKKLLFLFLIFIFLVSCARPPIEQGEFRKSELVELIKLDSSIKLDIRYATNNNFAGKAVYKQARAFLQKPAAEALVRVNKNLKNSGYGLLVFDGYRPWKTTKYFWDITSAENKKFVADPKKGSKHNRGCAVDLTLYNLNTGETIQMPGEYDEASERSYVNYTGGTAEQRAARDLLIKAMQAEGFTVYEYEWWHFDHKDWKQYKITNIPFEKL